MNVCWFRDLQDENSNNPFCKNLVLYLKAIENIKCFHEHKLKIDNQDIYEVQTEIKDIVYPGNKQSAFPDENNNSSLINEIDNLNTFASHQKSGNNPQKKPIKDEHPQKNPIKDDKTLLVIKNRNNEIINQGSQANIKNEQIDKNKISRGRSGSRSQDKPIRGNKSKTPDKPFTNSSQPQRRPQHKTKKQLEEDERKLQEQEDLEKRDGDIANQLDKVAVLEDQLRTVSVTYPAQNVHPNIKRPRSRNISPHKNSNHFSNYYNKNEIDNEYLESENERLKLENYHQQSMQAELESRKRELDDKQERNDKYWQQRVKGIEDSLTKERENSQKLLQQKNQSDKESKHFREDYIKAERDLQNNNKNHEKSEHKTEQLQNRLGEQLQMNNTLQRDKESKDKEYTKWQEEIKIIRGTNDELKNLLKGKENHFLTMQKETLRINEEGIKKLEELKRSEEDYRTRARSLEEEIQNLRKRNACLEEHEVERQTELKIKLCECEVLAGEKILSIEKENDNRVRDMEAKWETVLIEKERQWRENVDKLEEEFSGLVKGLNEKYKITKTDFEKKSLEVNELKGGLGISLSRAKELEDMVNDMNDALLLARKEIDDLRGKKAQVLTKDAMENEDWKRSAKKLDEENKKLDIANTEQREELRKSEQEIRSRKKEISEKGRECYDLRQSLEEQQDVVRRIEEKFKVYEYKNVEEFEDLKNKLDEMSDDIKIKNKILEERNRELEGMKSTVASKNNDVERCLKEKDEIEILGKERLESLEFDLERLRGKYNKKNDLVDDFERKIAELNQLLDSKEEELMMVKEELESKGKVIDDCIEQIKELQVSRKREDHSKDNMLVELEGAVEVWREKCDGKNRQLKEIEGAIVEIDRACNKKVEELEKECGHLKADVLVKEKEVRTQLIDIERQKVKAKEAIDHFQKFLS